MTDLISRQAAIEAITRERNCTERLDDYTGLDIAIAILESEDELATIDPVKHGKWKNKQMLDEELNPTIAFRHRCSECRFEICTTDETLWWNYCPNCGAKNGGEDDGPV